MEDEKMQTFPEENLAEERPTNHYDVTGDNSHFSATETGALENQYSFENRKDDSGDVADSALGGHFSGQDVNVGNLGMDLMEYGGRETRGGDAHKREEEESEHAEDRNGQLRNLQPSDMNYDGHSGNISNLRVNDGASFGTKYKNLAGEDQVGYDNRGNESMNVLGENGPYYVSAPIRRMFDGSRVPEPDDSQIIDTKEGADNIPGVDDLPIFANDQSKALNDEIKRREGLISQVSSTLVDNRERVRIMEEHLKNVRQEVDNTNALVAAKKKEIATEEHLCALATRDASRYAREARRFMADTEEAQDKLNTVQNAMFSANEGMDRFKLQMNWNQEELEQWALAAKQKEEDNLALQKYTRADDVKIKELSLQIERLSKSVVEKRADLQNLEAESSAKQVELDNTAVEFRRLHDERQDLVRQWQDAVDGMHRRDDEMNVIGEKYAKARQLRAERMEILSQNVTRLNMQKDYNEEVKYTIEKLERVVQRRREESQDAQKRLEEFRDVLEVVKNTLANGAGALARKRTETANLSAQIEGKRANLEAARKKYRASKRQVETETRNANKVEATAKSAEDDLQHREDELRAAKKRLNTAKETMFKDSEKLYVLRQEEANLIAEICGAQATMKSLQTKVRSLDQEQTRQQELVYTAEFQIQHMERKVARGMGERTDDEKTALNTKIRELEGEMESSREKKKVLTAQARKLNNELRACLRRKETAESQQSELKEAINEHEVECKVSETDVRREAQIKEEMMVSNDIIRLKMKRLRDNLNGTADEVFSLENRRQQLTMSMTERKAEIQVHWDLQRATLRAAEEERHRVQMELCERRLAVENIRARYETLVKGFAGAGGITVDGGGGDGSQRCSQAYFVIAAAQRREELQREGDELDQKIRRCEREVRALESTLRHLNARNVDFRISFQRADPGCRDAEALRKLEARATAAQDGLFRRKKELQRAQTDHEEDLARLEEARERTARLGDQNAQLEAVKDQAEAQLQAQQEALAKEQARLDRQRARHRAGNSTSGDGENNDDKPKSADAPPSTERVATAKSSDGETITEKALRANTLRDTASGVLYTLGQLSREFPEMHEALNFALKTRRLKIPPAPPAHGPSRIPGGIEPGRSRSSSSRGSADSGSSIGSGLSRRGAESPRSSRSGGHSDGLRQGGGLGDRRGSQTGAANGAGISPMRVFEAPL